MSHLDTLVFVDIHPTYFVRSGEYLLKDAVGRGSKGCAKIWHVSREGIRVQSLHPGVAEFARLHALDLQSGEFGKFSDRHGGNSC